MAYGTALPEQWGVAARNVDFYDVKGDVEALFAPAQLSFLASPHPASHPGRSAQVLLRWASGGLDRRVASEWLQQYGIPQLVVWFEVELACIDMQPMYHMPVRFPSFPGTSRYCSSRG